MLIPINQVQNITRAYVSLCGSHGGIQKTMDTPR